MATTTVDTRAEIETPENVTLTFDLAGPGSRMAAYVLDFVFRLAILYLLTQVLSLISPLFGTGLSTGATLVAMFFLEWGYGSLFEGFWNGRTPGKRIYRLRVIKDAGYPIGFYEAVLRNLLRAADILPIGYGAGLICMCSTRRMQRIGDLVAGTMVVHETRERLRHDPEVCANARPLETTERREAVRVSERTLDVIERLFSRQGTLSQGRQEEIAALLAKPLADQLGASIENTGRLKYSYFLRRVLKTFSGSGGSE